MSGSLVSAAYESSFRSPPVPLVALLGCPEAHKEAADYFLHTLKPPLVSLCCKEPVEQFVQHVFSPGAQFLVACLLKLSLCSAHHITDS